MYTASTAFLEALTEAGVSYIFANFGSDHPPIIEALAEAKATGRTVPRVITCPNEMVAMSAAHGFAQVTGQAQAVFVHVEVGTQALAGAIHNAAKGRVPVFVFAGASPFTQHGELPGSRNEFVQWIQDVFDQRGIVRGYTKYDNEIRTGKNIKDLVHRAMQFAHSEPKGPVYLMAAREVLEEEVWLVKADAAHWPRVAPSAIPASSVATLVEDLIASHRPLVVTSYLGRNFRAVEELVRFSHKLGIGVLESVPSCVNFPSDNRLYQGNQWNEPRQNRALGEADLILILDSDVPWIPAVSKPRYNAKIYHIDVDPLKQQMPLWQFPAVQVFRADAETALKQINEQLLRVSIDEKRVEARRSHYTAVHEQRQTELLKREQPQAGVITPEYLTACVRQHLNRDAIVVHEGVTNSKTIIDHMCATQPGTLFTSGGGALGWSGGAAIGVKLAHPDKTVVCLTGDGSFMFSVPSSVFWIAKRYETPFLQVIYNNGGWKAPKMSALSIHQDGYASKADDIGVAFDPPPDYSGIAAAAGGAFARVVRHPDELDMAVTEALNIVSITRRCAVLDVWLPHL